MQTRKNCTQNFLLKNNVSIVAGNRGKRGADAYGGQQSEWPWLAAGSCVSNSLSIVAGNPSILSSYGQQSNDLSQGSIRPSRRPYSGAPSNADAQNGVNSEGSSVSNGVRMSAGNRGKRGAYPGGHEWPQPSPTATLTVTLIQTRMPKMP
ncbi:hypothetical protein L596_009235 [Steinernema carpocapsae]|uniref:Uncharacterized protein n=1 Tax=Steinernema carpocapsae TaxID=34508 RepID=A0A4U5PET1_STECR|nr:hypothetical protein L596_009235 [Steinernema carpocapsae]